MKTDKKAQALAKHLDCEVGELKQSTYDKNTYDAPGGEYLVLTDKEATRQATERIKDSIWAFRPEFIASHSRLGHDATIKVCKALQEECEGANEAITALIKSIPKFVADAIRGDGRGHFLSGYDSEENEEKVGATRYYIYRTN